MKRAISHKRLWQFVGAAAPAAALALVVYLAYPSVLGLSFTFDDPLDLPRAENYSVWTMFTSAPGYGYYRPVLYVVWQGLRALLGRYDPFWFHLLTLGAHVINGWLVYLLGSRIANKASGLAAAILFVLFPFSYQVVPWAGALFHPFMTMLVLGALLLFDEARRRRQAIWVVPASGLALVALFTHEYGITVAPLATLWTLLSIPSRSLGEAVGDEPGLVLPHKGRGETGWRRFRYAAPFFVLDGIFLVAWWLVPKWGRQTTLDVDSLRLNGLYFLQAFIYPMAGLAKPLSNLLGWEATTSLGMLVVGVIAVLALLYRLGGRPRIFIFSALWFAIAALPAWAVLSFDYVIDAPRLLYLASVGICLAWGGLIGLFAENGILPSGALYVWRTVVAVGLIFVALQSWQFIAARNVLYETGSALVKDVVATTAKAKGRALYINLPAWIGPKADEYALGHSGVVLIPNYIGLNAVNYINTGSALPANSASYEILLKPWAYDFGLHDGSSSLEALDPLIRQASSVYVTSYQSDGIKLEEAGNLREKQPAPTNRLADLGGEGSAELVSLVAGRVTRRENDLAVPITWYVRGTAGVDYTVFLHLYDDQGRLVAQNDGYPLLQLSPPRLWQVGDEVSDQRLLPLPAEIQPGRYTIAVGMYDRQGGQRLVARDVSGVREANDAAVVGTVEIP